MIIDKPDWVATPGTPIFGVSVHPDGTRIATGGADHKARIWSLLPLLDPQLEITPEGVAWDPVGKYLATQSDDRSVIIWRVEDWTQLEAVRDPFKHWIGSTFSLRPSWSPDGQFLIAVNCFQSPCHTAAVLQRANWSSTFTSFVGHKAPVVAAACNPHLFYPAEQQPKVLTMANGPDSAQTGGEGGSAEAPAAGSIIALGSQDARLTIWRVDRDRPVVVANRVFEHTVVDLAWTPDGYHLIASSMDGTLAAFHFDPGELGQVMSQEEVGEAMQQLYGDTTARTAWLAESAAQLQAEAASHASLARRQSSNSSRPSISPGPTVNHVPPAPPLHRPADGGRAAKRMMPERVAPGPAAAGQTGPAHPAQGRQQVLSSHTTTLPTGHLGSVVAASDREQNLVRQSPTATTAGLVTCNLGSSDSLATGPEPPRLLEARNQPTPGASGSTQTRVMVTCNGERIWSDGLQGRTVAVCGNLRFAAVALQGGLLQVYTAAGRRWWPQMQLRGEIAQLSCTPHSLQLLILTTLGDLHLLNLETQIEELPRASLASLLSAARPHCQVVSAKLSAAGVPLVTLSDQRAFVYHQGFQLWLLVADQTLPATTFLSTMHGPSVGELGQLQRDAVKAGRLPLRETINARMNAAADDRGRLESNLAGSLAMENAAEHRRWLTTYVRHLSGK
ncbi:hypothetical protein WJX84_004683 [Apatococcus fuscideae]|uniref:Protein HIRA n=1 Tax=Apatococcus fuscideae TaxID=2026836 RepID=A0AAW1SWX0_9CHLO